MSQEPTRKQEEENHTFEDLQITKVDRSLQFLALDAGLRKHGVEILDGGELGAEDCGLHHEVGVGKRRRFLGGDGAGAGDLDFGVLGNGCRGGGDVGEG